MSEEQLRQLITSNAKAISALTNLANEVIPRIDEMQRQINNMQRDSVETKRHIDDTTADIRELMLENQRILRYLENIVNREN
ncbi:DUF5798 family protein [Moorena sp. SIO4G3]|uniref:DUF5798 family protein n=1 Tax=Moorena sp. SIO4G3 TaxID=2607821 RepID=UPI00142AA6D4|nr:DUF5798 family protein [Moorena sp. SIO4G3]NEO76302.1 hypothetical protein [Moorena sp. SIO4G3]